MLSQQGLDDRKKTRVTWAMLDRLSGPLAVRGEQIMNVLLSSAQLRLDLRF